jgi:DNA-nicking Smr family endonuclease
MRNGNKLTSDDRILWGKVARTTRALPGRMDEIYEFDAEMLAREQASLEKVEIVKPSRPPKASPAVDVAAKEKTRQQHHPLERMVKKKLARGRVPLEARIDLHGLIQSEAHILLHSFILRAHERGLRHVLVITGKGASMGSDGALKRAVPMWFAKPEFRHLISSYEPAAQNHGGEGALYVRLSRNGERDHDPFR